MVDGILPERSAPTAGEAAGLHSRLDEIGKLLTPADPETIAGNVAKLFVAMSKRSEGGEDEQERLMVYVEVLGDVPEFAISSACGDFLYGRAGDRKWLPSPAELRQVCAAKMAPWVQERERIKAVLTAEIVSPNDYGQRAKNLAHVKETLAMLAGAKPEEYGDGLTDKQRAEKWLAEDAERAKAPIGISGSLAKLLKSQTAA